jgi:phage-related baseplate assembly protein
MTTSFSGVNLATMPLPDIVEELSYEAILSAMIADLQTRDQTFSALVESDPAYKILEVCAYRELLMRARVNDATKAVCLAYAVGADLDNLAANFNVKRLIVREADNAVVPPLPIIYESDDALRRRVQLSFEGYSTAGSTGAYIFHALSVDGSIRDVAVKSPSAGQVLVTVQTYNETNGGLAGTGLLGFVTRMLNDEKIRPLTDQVTVQGVTNDPYQIVASLVISALQPDAEIIRQEAVRELTKLVTLDNTIGRSIPLSAIYAALHRPNVTRVILTQPTADITVADTHAAYCTSMTVTIAS